MVSLVILFDSMLEVSEIFNFKAEDVAFADARLLIAFVLLVFNSLILLDNEIVSVPILSETNWVFAKRPLVGKVTLLVAVVVIVKSPTPFEIILFAMVIVFPLLFTPVPPLILGKIEVIVIAESEKFAFAALNE